MWKINLYKNGVLVDTLSYPDQHAQVRDALRVAREYSTRADSWWFTPSDWKGPKASSLN